MRYTFTARWDAPSGEPIIRVLVDGEDLGLAYYADTVKDFDGSKGLLLHGGMNLTMTHEECYALGCYARGLLEGRAAA